MNENLYLTRGYCFILALGIYLYLFIFLRNYPVQKVPQNFNEAHVILRE